MVQKKKTTKPKVKEKTAFKKKKEKVDKRPRKVVKKAKIEKKVEKTEAKEKLVEKIEEKAAEKTEVKEEKPAEKVEVEKIKKEKPVEKIKHYGKRKLASGEKATFKLIYKTKKRKPHFARPEFYKFKKLKDVWRRPRGIDSKQIEEKRGKPKIPKIGYKKPNSVTGLHPFGFIPVIVHNPNELKKLNPEIEGAIIAKSVGRKKRNEIIKVANTSRITILNPRKGEL